jgi:rhodanese-related sulfurtransferase
MSQVLAMHPKQLKERLDRGDDVFLLDVREEWEHGLSRIEGSTLIPLSQVADRVQEFMFEEEIVVYCHHGVRSHHAAVILLESGFKKVHNLTGGIDAWSQIVDPSVPRY